METQRRYGDQKFYMLAIILLVIAIFLDQWTKILAVTYLKEQEPVILIRGVFQLQYLENRGAAFGLLQDQRLFFLVIGTVILVVIGYLYCHIPAEKKYLPLRICGVFIAAGAVGNMLDRARLGYVVDFLYFKLIDFPIFNVADIYVTIFVFLLILLILFYYKEEDIERIFQSKTGGRGTD